MTEFTERYKKLSNSELLKILAESHKYNPIAIKTAQTELDYRNLSTPELNLAKTQINELEKKKKLIIEKRKHQKEKIKKGAFIIIDTINPIQNGIQTPEKIIRFITLIFGAIAMYRIFNDYRMLSYMLTNSKAKWDFSLIEYFLPLILLPIAIVLFWKRKKTGWILLSIFLAYSSSTAIVLFFMNLGRQPSGIPGIESIFPTISPMTYITSLLFFGATLWLVCKENVRDLFSVSKDNMYLTIGLTILIDIIYMYSFTSGLI